MLSYFVRTFVNIYSFLILLYILASWFPDWQRTKAYDLIYRLVVPYLRIFKKYIPPIGFIDISPMIALFCLKVIPVVILYVIHFILVRVVQAPWLVQFF